MFKGVGSSRCWFYHSFFNISWTWNNLVSWTYIFVRLEEKLNVYILKDFENASPRLTSLFHKPWECQRDNNCYCIFRFLYVRFCWKRLMAYTKLMTDKLRLYHVSFALCKWRLRNFLRRSPSHYSISPAIIYIKTSSPHGCQCMQSISVMKACIKVTYGDVVLLLLLI